MFCLIQQIFTFCLVAGIIQLKQDQPLFPTRLWLQGHGASLRIINYQGNKINKYLEYLEDTMLPSDFSDSEEFVDFLNSLTEEVPNMSITPSKEVLTCSTSSSSGSSPVYHSPDSPDSVVPGTSSSS